MAKVLIPLANGFEDIEAVSIVDVLRRGGVEVVAQIVMRSKYFPDLSLLVFSIKRNSL